MKVVVQRVAMGSVTIEKENYYEQIGNGFVILLGIKEGDAQQDAIFLADKCSNLRVFEDSNEKMNLSLKDINGEVLVISQFTLYGDVQRGNRPSFTLAAGSEAAIPLYNLFINRLKENLGNEKVKAGIFGAMMDVNIFNSGPVTIIIDSKSQNTN